MKPPLPTASNFPFQLAAAGNQTSKLICESLVGAENAITRQKRWEILRSRPGPIGPGGIGITKSGGGLIAVAEMTVALGILRDVRLSQDCCAADCPGAVTKTARQTKKEKSASQRRMPMPP